jgi:hypothetical protein
MFRNFLYQNVRFIEDFNVNLKKDNSKAEGLLTWTDTHFLVPFIPDSPTYHRSDRTIDFAFCRGCSIVHLILKIAFY